MILFIYSVSLAVVLPFYAASVVEAVQSDIASEKPGIFDVFQEGFCRLLSWSAPQTGNCESRSPKQCFDLILAYISGRLLPIWIIVCPAVLCGTLHYVASVIATGLTRQGITLAKKRNQRKQARNRSCIADDLSFRMIDIYFRLCLGCRIQGDEFDGSQRSGVDVSLCWLPGSRHSSLPIRNGAP